MNYLRHPRTLQEAFGPHTSSEIHEPRDPSERKHWLAYAAVVLLFAIVWRAVT